MRSKQRSFVRSILFSLGAVLTFSISVANAQTTTPLFKDYRGITIGMSADEVRGKLNNLKKGNKQVSYNRTAGDKPIVTITVQKM